MVSEEFVVSGKIALAIQKTRVAVATRIFSHMVEKIIRKHEDYSKLELLRKSKTADRKKTAALVKKLLKSSMLQLGKTMGDFKTDFESAKKKHAAYQLLLKSESQAFKDLEKQLRLIPLYYWLKDIKGLGLRYMVKLLVYIKDPKRFHHPSALRKYCGTVPGQRRQKGQEAHFVPELKGILLGQIAKNFLMNRSPYRSIYDSKKANYEINKADEIEQLRIKKENKQKITKEDWTPIKIHNYSRKAMINRFLVELWEAAFLVEGKEPPATPYILTKPEHNREPMIYPVTEDMTKQYLTVKFNLH